MRRPRPNCGLLLIILLLFHQAEKNASEAQQPDFSSCEPEFLEKCIKMGKAFFDHPENIFPSNSTDINRVCSDVFPKMWSEFIGCTKSFAASCISSSDLSQFNRAVGNSINSVHKMCTNEDYQKDYLKSAHCIKNAAIEETGCKLFYDELLNEITSPSESATLCCAHSAFKDCLMEETKSCKCQEESCSDSEQATTFARSIVDNAIGFILNRCSKSTQISNACQRFIPPEVKYEEPKSHSVEEGSYFPNIGGSSNSQGQPPANNNHVGEPVEQSSSSVSTTSSSTTVTNNERQPKQDLAEEEIRAYSDNEGEDESINFDEFFDLAVYKNLLSSSPPQKMMSQSGTSLLLFFAFILSMFMA
eukprot:14408.XXX_334637_331793_1 [CDS] Oithona nana genome sequencing.